MRFLATSNIKRYAMKALVLAIASFVAAAGSAFAAGGTSKGLITEMMGAPGGALIKVPLAVENPDSCSDASYFILPTSYGTNYEGLLSMLIAAQHAAKEVKFYVNGCESINGWPIVDYVYVYSN